MTAIDALHYLAVGDEGTYSHTGEYQSDAQQIGAIIGHLKAKKIRELTLYFHGGLVDEQRAASSIQRVMSALSGCEKQHAESLSFIWKTGFLETVRDNLDEVFTTKFGKSLIKWVIRTVSKKLRVDFAKSAVNDGLDLGAIEQEWQDAAAQNRAPFADMQVDIVGKVKGPGIAGLAEDDDELKASVTAELEQLYLYDDAKLEADWQALPTHIDADKSLQDLMSHSASGGQKGIISLGNLAEVIVKVGVRVIKRYLNNSDHGLQATVVEEACRAYFVADAGQWIWGSMKEKAAQMWSAPGCVGFDFMARLQREMPQLKLNLVGHSAGSVAICKLLQMRRAQNWTLPIGKIMWWAPACRADLFVEQVIEHQGEYEAFRMITMTDELEQQNALVEKLPWLYPSSLLYFISGVLEEAADTPIAGMARYHKEASPYQGALYAAMAQFLDVPGRYVLSKTTAHAPKGECSDAIDHGAFNADTKTLESLTEYLR